MARSFAAPQTSSETNGRGAAVVPAPASPYTADTFLRAAERALALRLCQHHSRLDPVRLAASLRCASACPAHPASIELLDSLPLVVYVPLV